MTRQDWRDQAACIGESLTLFFPETSGADAAKVYKAATAVCQRCPVRQPCLDFALETQRDLRGVHGVYGGLTPRQRRARMRAER